MKQSKQQKDKKYYELLEVKPLLRLLGISEEQIIHRDNDENPDFVLLHDGKRIGIEHTNCFQSEFLGNKFLKDTKSIIWKSLQDYQELMKQRGQFGALTVSFDDSIYGRRLKMSPEKFSKIVCDEIDKHLRNDKISEDLRKGGSEEAVKWLELYKRGDFSYRFVTEVDCFPSDCLQSVLEDEEVVDLEAPLIEAIQAEIEKKVPKADRYIKENDLDELWLYIVFPEFSDFDKLSTVTGSEKFDRIYLFSPKDEMIFDLSNSEVKRFPLPWRFEMSQ